MKRNKRVLWLTGIALVLTVLVTACGGAVDEPLSEGTPPGDATNEAVTPVTVDMGDVTEMPADEESPSEMPQPGIPDPETFMTERVKTALAGRLDVEMDAISVVSVEVVEWSDAALGCPMPGQAYAQVLTPGFEITLSAGGETYTYHTDMDGDMVLCGEDGQPESEVR